MTEAIANAYKHGAARPDLTVSLHTDSHTFELRVVNRPSEIERSSATGRSIGQEAMKGFSKQIGGDIGVDFVDGAYSISLTGPVRVSTSLFDIETAGSAAA